MVISGVIVPFFFIGDLSQLKSDVNQNARKLIQSRFIAGFGRKSPKITIPN